MSARGVAAIRCLEVPPGASSNACADAAPPVLLFGSSPSMRRLDTAMRRLADYPCSVFLSGETGTGKGLAARVLHSHSSRASGPFVHVDCASLAPALIESELFGHERGAFTGAVSMRRGRLEQAGHGTLFLDEIGELPLELQAKLLRVLEDREFERLGGSRSRGFTARVVAATHVDLARAVAEGRFRADLFYRIRVARLEVPPLRDRLEDIPGLVDYARARIAVQVGAVLPPLRESALELLAAHPWPGNVRELLNLLEAAAILLPDEEVGASALGPLLDAPPALVAASPRADRSDWSRADPDRPPDFDRGCIGRGGSGAARGIVGDSRITEAVRACGGNIAKAARLLGIPRSTLRYRLGLDRPERSPVHRQPLLPGFDTASAAAIVATSRPEREY